MDSLSITPHSIYQLGRMSNKRLVVAMANRIVRVIGPDGRPGFVVCDDSASFLPADRFALGARPMAA